MIVAYWLTQHVSPEQVPKDTSSFYNASVVHKLNHLDLVWYFRHLRINIPTSEGRLINPFYTWSTLWPGSMRKLGAMVPAAVEATVSRPLQLAAFARVLRARLSNIVSFWHQASCSFQKPMCTEIDPGSKKSEDLRAAAPPPTPENNIGVERRELSHTS